MKTGDFIGVGAMPQPDGSQKAIEVQIFAPNRMRGTGEGFRPWDRPGSTMTNGTVDTTVAGVNGPVLTVKYKDGEQKIIVGPDAPIVPMFPATRASSSPARISRSCRADKQPDGTLQTGRINVGRDGVVPP